MAKYMLKFEDLDDFDQSSIAGLRDNYPADEYAMQIWMKDNNIEVVFIMRDEIAEELGREPDNVHPRQSCESQSNGGEKEHEKDTVHDPLHSRAQRAARRQNRLQHPHQRGLRHGARWLGRKQMLKQQRTIVRLNGSPS